jgi:colanic acid/amylovoran biosynthesis protein
MVKAKANLSGSSDASIVEFLRAVYASDLFVVCGQGAINDVFPATARALLNFVDLALATGKPTVLFGQGIGPLTDPGLVQMASSVLPRTDLIAVREGKLGPEMLKDMKVASDSIMTTGDDAIELAFAARPQEIGDAIGVNIRFENHTGIGTELAGRLRPVFKRLSDDRPATLLPLPISRYPDFKDSRDIEELLSGLANFHNNGRDLDTPTKVIHQTGRCRVVVTAAYHAAVFALSQGIPVVGLAKSQYCLNKFIGLDHQFGKGVEIVMLESSTLEDDLAQAFERSWTSAPTLRPLLLEASRQQIEMGNAAYGRTAEMLTVRKAAA